VFVGVASRKSLRGSEFRTWNSQTKEKIMRNRTLALALAVVTGVAMTTSAMAAGKKKHMRSDLGPPRAEAVLPPAGPFQAQAPLLDPTFSPSVLGAYGAFGMTGAGEYPWWLDQARGNIDGH
jgi:hypothetical protein